MNIPHGIERTTVNSLLLRAWNTGIQRAADSYAERPIAFADDLCVECNGPQLDSTNRCRDHYNARQRDRYQARKASA